MQVYGNQNILLSHGEKLDRNETSKGIWARSCIPSILALERKDMKSCEAEPGLYGEFQATQGYVVMRPCLKKCLLSHSNSRDIKAFSG